MEKKFFLLIFCFCVFFSKAQPSGIKIRYYLDFADAYVLRIRLDSLLFKARDYCVLNGDSCSLYQMEVLEVGNISYNYHYLNNDNCKKDTIKKIKYVLVKKKIGDSLLEKKEYLITAFSSTSSLFLILNRMLYLPGLVEYEFHHSNSFLIKFIECGTGSKMDNVFDDFIKEKCK